MPSCQDIRSVCVYTLCVYVCVCVYVQVVPPVKTGDFKLTLSTNREPVQVMELFADMVGQVTRGGGRGRGLQNSWSSRRCLALMASECVENMLRLHASWC